MCVCVCACTHQVSSSVNVHLTLYIFLNCVYYYCVCVVCGGQPQHSCDRHSMEFCSILSSHLYVGSQDWAQATKLTQQTPLPTKPSRQPSILVSETVSLNLELTNSVRLVGQWTLGISLFLPPQQGNFGHTPLLWNSILRCVTFVNAVEHLFNEARMCWFFYIAFA